MLHFGSRWNTTFLGNGLQIVMDNSMQAKQREKIQNHIDRVASPVARIIRDDIIQYVLKINHLVFGLDSWYNAQLVTRN